MFVSVVAAVDSFQVDRLPLIVRCVFVKRLQVWVYLRRGTEFTGSLPVLLIEKEAADLAGYGIAALNCVVHETCHCLIPLGRDSMLLGKSNFDLELID